MRQVFVGSISHEFRTPLNAIINIIQSAPKVSEEYDKNYLEPVRNCSSILLYLVNDILDFSKINYN